LETVTIPIEEEEGDVGEAGVVQDLGLHEEDDLVRDRAPHDLVGEVTANLLIEIDPNLQRTTKNPNLALRLPEIEKALHRKAIAAVGPLMG